MLVVELEEYMNVGIEFEARTQRGAFSIYLNIRTRYEVTHAVVHGLLRLHSFYVVTSVNIFINYFFPYVYLELAQPF